MFTVCVLSTSWAQNVLTLAEARSLAQSANLDIQAANLEAQAAGMQVYKANAGLLPRIDWNFNTNGSFNKVNLNLSMAGRSTDTDVRLHQVPM